MYASTFAALAALALISPEAALSQVAAHRTLVVLLAHADDEGPVAPMLARYAREGVQIHPIIASNGSQGAGTQPGGISRPETGLQGDELSRVREAEARCASEALGMQAPILLGFPDGKLGDYVGDRSLLFRLTQRVAEELQRLHPDAIVTWGPDGGIGHPDHRIVSDIATQLVRTEAPGAPERLFYMSLPADAIRAMVPQRGAPPLLIPAAKYFTVRVSFAPQDLLAAERSMACHRSQFTPDVVRRVSAAAGRAWNGVIALSPAFPTEPTTDLFP